ncbi:hypothetical protein EYC84_001269 [Monilinia fructicola]|uniref:Uncharacterized protein n=1 Tax=Monilinia fructicola TaxID=38448 RepID=A0A5M9JK69_MONFR|nr:hypothetical protein EYC84_001269 [Monilinia fructicola]
MQWRSKTASTSDDQPTTNNQPPTTAIIHPSSLVCLPSISYIIRILHISFIYFTLGYKNTRFPRLFLNSSKPFGQSQQQMRLLST